MKGKLVSLDRKSAEGLTLQGQLLGASSYVKYACKDMSYQEDIMTERRKIIDVGQWKTYSDGYQKGWQDLKIDYMQAQAEPVCSEAEAEAEAEEAKEAPQEN